MLNNKLTILIILYEENLDIVEKCLNEIREYKIIIIDNANNKDLKHQIISNFRIHKYFLNKENIGFSRAANQGIFECDTEYLMLLTADCLIKSKDIQQLIISKEKYKDCFLIAPTLFDSKGSYNYNGGRFYEFGPKLSPIQNQGDVCVEAVITTAVLFKVKDIKDIGMFDENFFLYFLDDDLCKRIKKIKKSIVQVFNSKAIHESGNLKIKNKLKKIFFRNYYFDSEELYYLYKYNLHQEKYFKFKKKLSKFCFKAILNLFLFRLEKSTYYLAKIFAYIKFLKLIR